MVIERIVIILTLQMVYGAGDIIQKCALKEKEKPLWGSYRNTDTEGCPVLVAFFDLNLAEVVFNYAQDNGESHPYATTLGSEKRIENIGDVFTGDTFAGVGNPDSHAAFIMVQMHLQRPVGWHFMYGVDKQVCKNLLNL